MQLPTDFLEQIKSTATWSMPLEAKEDFQGGGFGYCLKCYQQMVDDDYDPADDACPHCGQMSVYNHRDLLIRGMAQPCPRCNADPGVDCRTPSGKLLSGRAVHTTRMYLDGFGRD